MPITYPEALAIVLDRAKLASSRGSPEAALRVPLAQACGRIAAESVASTENLPPFANSAVDGFAIRSNETPGASPANPVRIRSLGTIVAGDAPIAQNDPRVPRSVPSPVLKTGWEIMTGAPMPPGFDAAVKIEDVIVHRAAGHCEIELRSPVERDENVREAGEDFTPGMPVLARGEVVRPEHVLALAALGSATVAVAGLPRVAIISTGRELAEPGTSGETPESGLESGLESGKIRNSTGPYLMAALRELGVEVRFAGTVADEPESFLKLFRQVLAERPDVVITTGAVSMGTHDFIPAALHDLGAETRFHKLPIRPGKPILMAVFDHGEGDPGEGGPAVFALPGNPVSTAVGFRFFVVPYLRALQGQAPEVPLRARLTGPLEKPPGTRVFLKARLEATDSGELRARVLAGQASFMVSPLLEASAWAVVGEAGSEIPEGALVDVFPLSPGRVFP